MLLKPLDNGPPMVSLLNKTILDRGTVFGKNAGPRFWIWVGNWTSFIIWIFSHCVGLSVSGNKALKEREGRGETGMLKSPIRSRLSPSPFLRGASGSAHMQFPTWNVPLPNSLPSHSIHLLPVGLWGCYLTSLCFNFIFSEMDKIIAPTSEVVETINANTYVKCSAQGLAHSKLAINVSFCCKNCYSFFPRQFPPINLSWCS